MHLRNKALLTLSLVGLGSTIAGLAWFDLIKLEKVWEWLSSWFTLDQLKSVGGTLLDWIFWMPDWMPGFAKAILSILLITASVTIVGGIVVGVIIGLRWLHQQTPRPVVGRNWQGLVWQVSRWSFVIIAILVVVILAVMFVPSVIAYLGTLSVGTPAGGTPPGTTSLPTVTDLSATVGKLWGELSLWVKGLSQETLIVIGVILGTILVWKVLGVRRIFWLILISMVSGLGWLIWSNTSEASKSWLTYKSSDLIHWDQATRILEDESWSTPVNVGYAPFCNSIINASGAIHFAKVNGGKTYKIEAKKETKITERVQTLQFKKDAGEKGMIVVRVRFTRLGEKCY